MECIKCKRELGKSQFYPDKRIKSGYEKKCKDCKSGEALLRKSQQEVPSGVYVVYGYLHIETGIWHYIGCTCRPVLRRYEHESPSHISYTCGRFPQSEFKYHIFAKKPTKKKGLEAEKDLIQHLKPKCNCILYNKTA